MLTRDGCGSSATAGEKIIASGWSATAAADLGLSFRRVVLQAYRPDGECDAAPLGIKSN